MHMGDAGSPDARLDEALTLLRALLAQLDGGNGGVTPWEPPTSPRQAPDGRISATDQLSWWFRPATSGRDPWDDYFEEPLPRPLRPHDGAPWAAVTPNAATRSASPDGWTLPDASPPGRWSSLQLLLAEPEDEIIDADAESVVTCLYDFLHAIGRRDLAGAMACVHDDYSTMEDDREITRTGLAGQIRGLLDSLHGWDMDVSLVEVPHPILHPTGILIYAEMQVEARRQESTERRTIVQRRVAVFERAREGGWLIVGLSPV